MKLVSSICALCFSRTISSGELTRDELAELKRDAIRVLLKWARIIRERVVNGELNLHFLEHVAEPAETFAVTLLRDRADELGSREQIAELVAAIPARSTSLSVTQASACCASGADTNLKIGGTNTMDMSTIENNS